MTARVKVIPNTKKTFLKRGAENELRLYITQPALEGKANKAVIAYFSKILNCPKRDISILHGEKARIKTLACNVDSYAFSAAIEKNIKK